MSILTLRVNISLKFAKYGINDNGHNQVVYDVLDRRVAQHPRVNLKRRLISAAA